MDNAKTSPLNCVLIPVTTMVCYVSSSKKNSAPWTTCAWACSSEYIVALHASRLHGKVTSSSNEKVAGGDSTWIEPFMKKRGSMILLPLLPCFSLVALNSLGAPKCKRKALISETACSLHISLACPQYLSSQTTATSIPTTSVHCPISRVRCLPQWTPNIPAIR